MPEAKAKARAEAKAEAGAGPGPKQKRKSKEKELAKDIFGEPHYDQVKRRPYEKGDKLVVSFAKRETFYPSRTVAEAMDGASVNLGEKSGVGVRKQAEVPHILVLHAVAHNLELSVHDALDPCPEVELVQKLNQDLYTEYHGSAKFPP